ncbi:natural resistance-associated macrophage protein-domain-containing protein [Flagelloscypha sp. PMI_526]|nr:natural resistance-associated macrophage protein-domain-containing protein [Flagelloscypha sp. PMI_526]
MSNSTTTPSTLMPGEQPSLPCPADEVSSLSWTQRCKRRGRKLFKTCSRHVNKHTGIGIVCAVAYFDPGNWGVDLQAGSQFGYRLLFVVLLSGLFAVFLQCLASKLGCVTGLDLASHCRLLLHDRPKYTKVYRWGLLYPLYALSEVAIIATDLAELLGSAIAFCLLFPKLEIWHGVLITAFDVLIILFIGDPLRGRPVRSFELLIAALVFAVLICMAIVIARIDINWGDTFTGFIPSKYLFPNGALYTSIGILGATVMPHSLFLGSALATQDRLTPKPHTSTTPSEKITFLAWLKTLTFKTVGKAVYARVREALVYAFKSTPRSAFATEPKSHKERENKPYALIKAHYVHGMIDIVFSLLGFAVLINAMILILASAVFFYGSGSNGQEREGPASLFDAYDLIRDLVGQSSATLFALALLSAGQSSSIIATVAGQAVSEGFLRWSVSPVLRRLFTRLLSIIPSMLVAVIVGRKGVDALLVASQVVLSICLPFISAPLLLLTSSKAVMRVRKPALSPPPSTSTESTASSHNTVRDVEAFAGGVGADGWVDFSNSKLTILLGGAIWLVVVTANVYVLVQLGTEA